MPAWLSARRLLRIGPALLLGAIALGSFLLFFGEFVGGISSVLIVAIPVLVLLTLLGFIVTLIGAVGWALQAPIGRLAWLGIAFVSLGVMGFYVGEKMQFGFDDPGVLFMQAITFAPALVGGLFLLSAGIRRSLAIKRTPKGVRKNKPKTAPEIADLIERFLNGTSLYPQEWNDFVERRHPEGKLDTYRKNVTS